MPPRLRRAFWYSSADCCDIGTYRVFKHDGSDGEPLKFSKKRYILHGLKGYEYLLDEGVDESIAQFCPQPYRRGTLRARDVVRQEPTVATSRLCADESRAGSGDVRRQVP